MRHNFPNCEKHLKLLLSSWVYHLEGSLDPEQGDWMSQWWWHDGFKPERKGIYEELFHEDLQDLLEIPPKKKKKMSFSS